MIAVIAMKRFCVLQFPNVVARARNMKGSFRHIVGLSVPSGPFGDPSCKTSCHPFSSWGKGVYRYPSSGPLPCSSHPYHLL